MQIKEYFDVQPFLQGIHTTRTQSSPYLYLSPLGLDSTFARCRHRVTLADDETLLQTDHAVN